MDRDLEKYLNMQREHYRKAAEPWSIQNPDPVVGSYHQHNAHPDYDTFLFKDFKTDDLVAIEYGCGPGRNIIRFRDRFHRIDGVDISQELIEKARVNLEHHGIEGARLYHCDGMSIPVPDSSYDVVFSVICLQHIACYDIRFNIFKESYRVLKPGGHLCFQMAFGGRGGLVSEYYENAVDVEDTNGGFDVFVRSEDQLSKDLVELIGFKDFKYDIRPTGPGDTHANWIWVQVTK